MKKIKARILLLIIPVLAGCVTSTELFEKGDTLLIGSVIFSGTGFESWGELSMNGIVHEGIDIIMEETAAEQPLIMRSGQYGIFSAVDLPAGEYSFRGFILKKTVDAEEAIAVYESPYPMTFSVKKGMVNNLGYLFWILQHEKQNELKYDGLQEDLMTAYKNDYPKSYWTKKNWINVSLEEWRLYEKN